MSGLSELERQMHDCSSCDLYRSRSNVIFGKGSSKSSIMFIGESPTDEEDSLNSLFTGNVGEKFDSILKYINVEREDVYITNSVLCKTPNGRSPRGEELEACKWRLDLQIKLIKPKLIVVLGKIALQQLRGESVKGALSQYFPSRDKKWRTYKVSDHESKVMITYHPNFHVHAPKRAYNATLPHWTQVKEWVDGQ